MHKCILFNYCRLNTNDMRHMHENAQISFVPWHIMSARLTGRTLYYPGAMDIICIIINYKSDQNSINSAYSCIMPTKLSQLTS